MYYNKSMFDEAGETYPTDLFDKGEWDWNKMLELAETLTIDSNRDGTPEQYGLANEEQEHILYTTGKHLDVYKRQPRRSIDPRRDPAAGERHPGHRF